MTKPVPVVPIGSSELTLADAVRKVSDGAEALAKSGLNKKAIIVLLCHETKLSQNTVKLVLDALPRMKKSSCV